MDIPRLPLDTYYSILLQSDLNTIFKMCQANYEISTICRDESFWKEKLIQDFGIPKKVPTSYLSLYRGIYESKKSKGNYGNLLKAIDEGDLNTVKRILPIVNIYYHGPELNYSLDKKQYEIAKFIFRLFNKNTLPDQILEVLESHENLIYQNDDLDAFQNYRRYFEGYIERSEGFVNITTLPSMNIILGNNWKSSELGYILHNLIQNISNDPSYTKFLFRILYVKGLTLQQAFELFRTNESVMDEMEYENADIYQRGVNIYNNYLQSIGLKPENLYFHVPDLGTILN